MRVPHMTVKDVERAADELLSEYTSRRGAPLAGPVDVEFIIEKVLRVQFGVFDLKRHLSNPRVLGLTSVEARTIAVDESLSPSSGRYAFTLAHEIGHWQLHRRLLVARNMEGSLLNHELPDDDGATGGRRKPPIERQADQFAACLLMPARLVREAVMRAFDGRLPSWEGIESRIATAAPDPRFVEVASKVLKAGNFTNVSNTAMRIRLRDLKLVVDTSDPQGSLL